MDFEKFCLYKANELSFNDKKKYIDKYNASDFKKFLGLKRNDKVSLCKRT